MRSDRVAILTYFSSTVARPHTNENSSHAFYVFWASFFSSHLVFSSLALRFFFSSATLVQFTLCLEHMMHVHFCTRYTISENRECQSAEMLCNAVARTTAHNLRCDTNIFPNLCSSSTVESHWLFIIILLSLLWTLHRPKSTSCVVHTNTPVQRVEDLHKNPFDFIVTANFSINLNAWVSQL